MIATLERDALPMRSNGEARLKALVNYLRTVVFARPEKGERLHAIFFDGQRTNLEEVTIAWGGQDSLSLRMRDLFGPALEVGATSMVLAHNHPSGHCRPSEEDVLSTKRLQVIARALDIELLDHLIFTRSRVYSMRAGGDI